MNFSHLSIDTMATGNLSLQISCHATPATFASHAQLFKELTGAKVLFKIDNSESPMWLVLIQWRPFVLVYDPYISGLTLESTMSWCNAVVEKLLRQLNENNASSVV